MSDREKAQLIRRYTLPTTPHIVVHPNRQAKGGKFDCDIMSLSVLLDYHQDDAKERFFEVNFIVLNKPNKYFNSSYICFTSLGLIICLSL